MTALHPTLTTAVIKREPCRYGEMSWLANDHYIGRALDLYGEYSASEADLLRRVLKPGDTVVEAGANVGGLTVAIADIIGPTGFIWAYEPQPAYADCLQANLQGRGNARSLPMALGATRSRAESGSLPGIAMRRVEEARVHAPGWESTGELFTVPQDAVDNLTGHLSLLKIDVDGPEHDILIGAEKTIERCRPVLYVEFDKPDKYPDMLAWILARGYRIYQHMAPLYNPNNFRGNKVNVFGGLVSAMILCIPNERKDLRFPDLPRIRAEQVQ